MLECIYKEANFLDLVLRAVMLHLLVPYTYNEAGATRSTVNSTHFFQVLTYVRATRTAINHAATILLFRFRFLGILLSVSGI